MRMRDIVPVVFRQMCGERGVAYVLSEVREGMLRNEQSVIVSNGTFNYSLGWPDSAEGWSEADKIDFFKRNLEYAFEFFRRRTEEYRADPIPGFNPDPVVLDLGGTEDETEWNVVHDA
jgi:hypothetical protein